MKVREAILNASITACELATSINGNLMYELTLKGTDGDDYTYKETFSSTEAPNEAEGVTMAMAKGKQVAQNVGHDGPVDADFIVNKAPKAVIGNEVQLVSKITTDLNAEGDPVNSIEITGLRWNKAKRITAEEGTKLAEGLFTVAG